MPPPPSGEKIMTKIEKQGKMGEKDKRIKDEKRGENRKKEEGKGKKREEYE